MVIMRHVNMTYCYTGKHIKIFIQNVCLCMFVFINVFVPVKLRQLGYNSWKRRNALVEKLSQLLGDFNIERFKEELDEI